MISDNYFFSVTTIFHVPVNIDSQWYSYFVPFITHAGGSCVCRVSSHVCVCLFPHDVSRTVAARITKLDMACSTISQRSRSRGTENTSVLVFRRNTILTFAACISYIGFFLHHFHVADASGCQLFRAWSFSQSASGKTHCRHGSWQACECLLLLVADCFYCFKLSRALYYGISRSTFNSDIMQDWCIYFQIVGSKIGISIFLPKHRSCIRFTDFYCV